MAKFRNKDYVPDYRGTGQLLKSSDMARVVLAAAEVGADAARAAAPKDTGELAGSIRVEYAGENGGPKGDRVEAWIVADARHAAPVEFGTARQRAQPFLQAAIEAIEATE